MSLATGTMLPEPEAVALLSNYGIPYPEHGFAQSLKKAVRIAERIGFPVVLKVVSPDVIHKSDVGGVVVGIEDARGVSQAYGEIVQSIREHAPNAEVQGMLVCQQAPPGLEVIVGALHDAMFGPTLMFGLGGVFAEALKDVTFRVIPIERVDAEDMIGEIQGHLLLAGTRGHSGYDVGGLVDLLLAVSHMMADRPEIRELDLNPVRLHGQGLMALDARILLAGNG